MLKNGSILSLAERKIKAFITMKKGISWALYHALENLQEITEQLAENATMQDTYVIVQLHFFRL